MRRGRAPFETPLPGVFPGVFPVSSRVAGVFSVFYENWSAFWIRCLIAYCRMGASNSRQSGFDCCRDAVPKQRVLFGRWLLVTSCWLVDTRRLSDEDARKIGKGLQHLHCPLCGTPDDPTASAIKSD